MKSFFSTLRNPGPHTLARLKVLCQDDGLAVIVVWRLHIECQDEAHRALADIGTPADDIRIPFEQLLQAVHLSFRLEDRGILRQRPVDEQFGPVRCREELLRHGLYSVEGSRKDQHRYADGHPPPPHRRVQRLLEHGEEAAGLFVRVHLRRQQFIAEQRREDAGDEPGKQQRYGEHDEKRECVFAGGAAIEADREEARYHDQSAGQSGKRRRGVDLQRRLPQRIAFFQPGDHHFDSDHGVIHQEAERNDERAERHALQRDAKSFHGQECHRQHQRDGQRDDEAPRACPGRGS